MDGGVAGVGRRSRAAVVVLAVVALLGACSGSDDEARTAASGTAGTGTAGSGAVGGTDAGGTVVGTTLDTGTRADTTDASDTTDSAAGTDGTAPVPSTDEDDAGETSDTASTVTSAVDSEPGCGQTVPALDAAGIHRATIESSGGTRSYMVVVPSGYDPDVAAPLAYVFHGAGSNKEQQFVYSDFGPEAEASGALLVLPDALGSPMRWSPLGGAIAGVDGVEDLEFFDDLHAEIRSSWCVDPDRVLVSGMSSGGFMAGAVGCMRPDDVSAIGPVTATVPPDVLCPDGTPRPYVYFHGTADAAVPYEGGANSPGPVEVTSQAWADHNECVGPPQDERIGTEVVHRSWNGCAAPTDLYIVEEGGHTWPGAIDVGLGYVTRDIDATAIIWETFVSSWT